MNLASEPNVYLGHSASAQQVVQTEQPFADAAALSVRDMNNYPLELRTPPLPTVLLVGNRNLHAQLRAYFTGTLRPPVHVIGDPDLANLSSYFCGERL